MFWKYFKPHRFSYGYTEDLKIICQNIQHIQPKLDEIKYNIGNMKDEFKPHILGMCESFWKYFKPHRFSIF
jgi:hypothetical protein